MKKLYYFLAAGILLATAGGFLVYEQLQKKQASGVWQLIPDNALLVASLHKPAELLTAASPAWQDFLSLTRFENLLRNVQQLAKKEPDFQNFLGKNQVFVSFHATAPHDFGTVFYLPADPALFEKLRKNYATDPAYRTDTRTFQGVQIQEIILRQDPKQQFSFILHEHYLIGSFTPFLIEDNIRHLQSGSFFVQKPLFQPVAGENNSPLQFYLTGNGFDNLLKLFVKEETPTAPGLPGQVFDQSEWQAELTDNQLVLFGKSRTAATEKGFSFLDVLSRQVPQPLLATHLIPDNTGLLYHLGFSNGSLLLQNLNRFRQIHQPALHQRRLAFSKKYKTDLDTAGHFLTQEILIGQLEGNAGENNRFVLLKTRNEAEAGNFFGNVAKQVDLQDNAEPFLENYAGIYLHQIHAPEFPEMLVGSLASGFPQCFYAEQEGYILLAGNLATLKSLLDNANAGSVWKNSPRKTAFLSKILSPANFSLLLDVPRAWNFLPDALHPAWQPALTAQADGWKNFQQVALQAVATATHSFQTSAVAFYQPSTTAGNVLGKFYPVFTARLDTTFTGQVFLFKNPAENTFQCLVQDKAYQLYCFDKNGKVQFKKFLNHPLEGRIESLDFYKNNRPNYAIIAQNDFFIFTNKGEAAQNFPLAVPSFNDLNTLSVLDYEKNKDYRLMLSDKSGNLFLYNKSGSLLEGWNPKKSGYKLTAPVRHLRVASRDYLFGMQANGTAQVWTRKGQAVAPFPLNIGERINTGVFVKTGAVPEETMLNTISEEGQLVQFSLAGQVTGKKQFLRTSRESVFSLCIEEREKDFFIVRQDPGSITVLDKNANTLISKDLDNVRQNCKVQYYDFGADVKVFFITQPEAGKTFVFDYTGKAIGSGFENQAAVSVLYVSELNKLLILGARNKSLEMVSVKIK